MQTYTQTKSAPPEEEAAGQSRDYHISALQYNRDTAVEFGHQNHDLFSMGLGAQGRSLSLLFDVFWPPFSIIFACPQPPLDWFIFVA